MTLEADIRAYTLADPAVAGVIGQRMHVRRLPQGGQLPALVYGRISTRREHDLQGPDGAPRARMQLVCWAASPADAYRLADAVRRRLDGFRGSMGAGDVGAVQCGGERDIEDPDGRRFGVALDFVIFFYEQQED